MSTVVVIDYGMGNLHSVAKAVEHAGRELGLDVRVSITADAEKIAAGGRVIFPGVGAIRDCMAEIDRLNVGELVAEAMQTRPVLAICVGMQALMEHSAENDGIDCLGLVPGNVRYFGDDLRDETGVWLKVPHMGWNAVRQTREHPLWAGVPCGQPVLFCAQLFCANCPERSRHRRFDLWRGDCFRLRRPQYLRHPVPSREKPDRWIAPARQFPAMGRRHMIRLLTCW